MNTPEVKTVKTATNAKHRLRTVIAAAALTGTILAGTTGVAAAAQGDTLVHVEADDSLGSYRPSDGKVYLRNSNTPGIADAEFFFADADDVPSNYDALGLYSVGLSAVEL